MSAECIKDEFGIMWYGDHAYMRSVDRDAAIRVRLKKSKKGLEDKLWKIIR